MTVRKLFGSSGIRGDAKEMFTDQFCSDLGKAFAIFLERHHAQGSVAVGIDPRESSPRIKDALIQGLRSTKRDVYDEGIVPIPAMNWILRSDTSVAGSVMVTGSHIKAHLNGLKFFAFENEILKEHEAEIESIYTEITMNSSGSLPGDTTARILISDMHKQSYLDYLYSKAEKTERKLKIVLDAGNGAQSETAPMVLRHLGYDVVEMYTDVSAELLSRDTEVSGDFQELQERVVAENADLGIGFDSDGDRVVFITEQGEFIPGDYSGSLIAKGYSADAIVTPVNTSLVVDAIGKRVIRTKVGSPYVVTAMQESGSQFGFEANGGGIFSDMYSRDGGRSMIEFLDIIQKSRMKVSEVVRSLPSTYIFRDKVDYDWDLKDRIVAEAKNTFQGARVEELDGLKIWIDDTTWILFRSSANAPEFRVFVESSDRAVAQKLIADGMALVSKYKKE